MLLEDQLHARGINLHNRHLRRDPPPRRGDHRRQDAVHGAAMAAEMERDLIRERTLDGLRAAQAQGRRGGRPAVVNDDVLAVARARQSRGESVTAIARHLKIGRSTLYRALQPHERHPVRTPVESAWPGPPPTGCAPAGSSWHWPSGAAIPPIEVYRGRRPALRQRRPSPGIHRRRDRPADHRRLRDRDPHHRAAQRHNAAAGGLTR